MNRAADRAPVRGLASLRRFVERPPAVERCDLCSLALTDRHQHLIDPKTRRLVCACNACAILFSSGGETQYRRVPLDVTYLSDFCLSDALWNSLMIPIGLVFIYFSSAEDKTFAVYPSPAGPTETVLDRDSWQELARENPVLGNIRPDVEALLINRTQTVRDYLLAPIDECYKLTGLIRKHWRGFSGGDDAWEQIRIFFDDLKERSQPATAFYAGSHV